MDQFLHNSLIDWDPEIFGVGISEDFLDASYEISDWSGSYNFLNFAENLEPMPNQTNQSTPEPLGNFDHSRVVSISSTFYPGFGQNSSDRILQTSDLVVFYVHSHVLLANDKDAFSSVLSAPLSSKEYEDVIIDVPIHSSVLNIIIHTLYGMPCAKHSPSFDVLEEAVNIMPRLGIAPKTHIVPSSPLYDLLLSHAPIVSIQLYILAAQHDLCDLALNTSPHLLSYDLSKISDDMAQRMGARYLKRLMCLHLERVDALKHIFVKLPHPHAPTRGCDFTDQKHLSGAWALASSNLAWTAKPDLPIHTLQSSFDTLGQNLTCELCKESLRARIKDAIGRWASVKV